MIGSSTARMRYNLLYYSNIMFLDGQNRMYNKSNWPSIEPVIKTIDNRVGGVSEAIVTAEDSGMCTWMLKLMIFIESHCSAFNIQIIYIDDLITSRLL